MKPLLNSRRKVIITHICSQSTLLILILLHVLQSITVIVLPAFVPEPVFDFLIDGHWALTFAF